MSNELKKVEILLKQVEGDGVYSKDGIHSPEDAVRAMAEVMSELDREEVCVINVDTAGHPINFNVVSIGDLNTSLLSVRNVFKTAILANAASILIMHNHPSSNPEMSKDDKLVTKKLMYASTFMDIPVLDHIIVGGRTGECYSMRAHAPELFDTTMYGNGLKKVADGGASVFAGEVKEDTFLYQTEAPTQYGIYQIAEGGKGKPYQFMGTSFVKEQGLHISGQDYNLVYSGVAEPGTTLDLLYEKFNVNHPKDFTGHSLSVSDVILWKDSSGAKAYYVDSFGFTELPDFIQQREQAMNQEQNQGKKTRAEAVKEITDKLEQGVSELFDSEKYKEYLNTMAKFHSYSFNNTLLIAMQKPDATLVASYNSWQKNFHRNVKKGEKGIRIFAPSPYKRKEEQEVKNPFTGMPLVDEKGSVHTEEVEKTVMGFRAVSVFDVSQTVGEPLPQIGADELLQSVEDYSLFMEALQQVSPAGITFENIESQAKGYYDLGAGKIVIQSDMSESQTLKTLVHEIAHSLLHGKDRLPMREGDGNLNRSTKEVEAESVAYTFCKHFGIDTSDYSFSYLAGWSSGKEMKELRQSMETIRRTASKLISDVESKVHELRKERSAKQEEMLMIGNQIREKLQTNVTTQKVIAEFKEITEKQFHPLDGMSASGVENVICEYVSEKLKEKGLDVTIVDVAIIGSRCRGVEGKHSDLDVVLEYKGDMREDDLFQLLHEDSFQLDGVVVDINPITEGKSGTLASYLPKAQEYMDKQLAFSIADRFISIQETEGGYDYSIMNRNFEEIDGGVYDNPVITIHAALEDIVDDLKRNPDTNGAKGKITPESELVGINYEELMEMVEAKNKPKPVVTFTVAECGEFHQMGASLDDLGTMEEALEKWEGMKNSPLNGIPALGIRVHHPGQEEYTDEQIDLVGGRFIDVGILEYIPSMTKEPFVMEKVAEMIAKMPDYTVRGEVPIELSVQMMLRQLDSEGTVFSEEERNLIVDYGLQLGDMERTRDLAEHIYAQEKFGNQDVALAMIDAREEMRADMRKTNYCKRSGTKF